MKHGIGFLVIAIFDIIYEMRYFYAMMMVIITMFANAFYAVSSKNNLINAIKSAFFLTFKTTNYASLEEEEFDYFEGILVWSITLLSSMFFLYVLLNMTVSMVKGFFDKNMR
jgi:hypothetical protein